MAEQKNLSRTVRIDLTPGGPPTEEQTRMAIPAGEAGEPVRRKAETAPFDPRQEELLTRLYDAALITNLRGRISNANPRAVEFLHYSHDELCALQLRHIIFGADEDMLASLEDHLEKGDFALIQGYCIRKDRTIFPAEIAVNMLRLGGRRLCFFIRDISVRKQTENLLRTGYNAMQNAAAGIAILDAKGRFEYVNPATLRLWHYRREEELLARSFLDLVKDETEAQAMLGQVLDRQQEWSGEMIARRRDGSEFAVRISAACNRNPEGEPAGAVVSLVDISDAKRVEEALRESERQHAMLASLGAACHHLAQPATVLIGNIGILQDLRDPTAAELREIANSSAEAAQELAHILHQLNMVNQYRTTPYLSSLADNNAPENRLLDIGARRPRGAAGNAEDEKRKTAG